MKNKKYLLLSIFSFLFLSAVVQAEEGSCGASVLKTISVEANYVKADYEIIDESRVMTLQMGESSKEYRIPNYKFEITLTNLTENLYVSIKTTKAQEDDDEYSVYYGDTENGTYTFMDENFGDIYNYVITVKPVNQDCEDKTIRTLKFTKPRYNAFSEFAICQNSSIFYCQRFIGTEINITTDEFLKKVGGNNKNNENNNDVQDDKKEESLAAIFKKNWKSYVAIFISISLVTFIALNVLKKRDKKKRWNS